MDPQNPEPSDQPGNAQIPDGTAPGDEPVVPGDPDQATLAEEQAAKKKRNALIVAAAVLAAIAIVVVVLLVTNEDDKNDVATDTTTSTTDTSTTTSTTEPTTTSTTEATTTTTSTPSSGSLTPPELESIVWPAPGSGTTYSDPVTAARATATGLLGFTDPTMGDFAEGDNRSGEVEVQGGDSGVTTTILVRQMSDDMWYSLGSTSENIGLDNPAAGATITSPVTVSGQSRSFEGGLLIEVKASDGSQLGTESVIGGSGPDSGPFSGSVSFDAKGDRGVLIVRIDSAKDGSVSEAVSIPVTFG